MPIIGSMPNSRAKAIDILLPQLREHVSAYMEEILLQILYKNLHHSQRSMIHPSESLHSFVRREQALGSCLLLRSGRKPKSAVRLHWRQWCIVRIPWNKSAVSRSRLVFCLCAPIAKVVRASDKGFAVLHETRSHGCGHSSCVSLAHLRLGDAKENNTDRNFEQSTLFKNKTRTGNGLRKF